MKTKTNKQESYIDGLSDGEEEGWEDGFKFALKEIKRKVDGMEKWDWDNEGMTREEKGNFVFLSDIIIILEEYEK